MLGKLFLSHHLQFDPSNFQNYNLTPEIKKLQTDTLVCQKSQITLLILTCQINREFLHNHRLSFNSLKLIFACTCLFNILFLSLSFCFILFFLVFFSFFLFLLKTCKLKQWCKMRDLPYLYAAFKDSIQKGKPTNNKRFKLGIFQHCITIS